MLIFLFALLVGGVFYFIGSQKNSTSNNTSEASPSPTGTGLSAASSESTQIESEINETAKDTPDLDLRDIARAVASFK
jgi:hypothetical protein